MPADTARPAGRGGVHAGPPLAGGPAGATVAVPHAAVATAAAGVARAPDATAADRARRAAPAATAGTTVADEPRAAAVAGVGGANKWQPPITAVAAAAAIAVQPPADPTVAAATTYLEQARTEPWVAAVAAAAADTNQPRVAAPATAAAQPGETVAGDAGTCIATVAAGTGNGADGGNGGGNGGFGGINGTFGTNGAGGTGGLGTLLGGHNGNIGLNGATGGIGSTTLTNATVPLQLVNTTEPVVFISLNGGQMVPVLLDTGSTGLVMDSQFLTQNFGPVIGTGTAGYAGGLTYNYNTYSTTVDFGNGLLTLPTSVNVVTSSSPGTLGNFLSRSGAVGVLGIGPNNGFPGTSSIVTAMPGLLNNGVLIDESAGILQFGPNTLTGGITISGAPISTVAVQIDNGPLQQAPVMFDSGGINGTIPSALASLPSGGFVPAGTTISVYTSDGQTLLYSYTTTATNTPFVTSGGVMNTGHVPFAQQPIYVSYSPTAIGTTTFN